MASERSLRVGWALVAVVLLVSGCATSTSRADAAFARQDWDDAARRYQKAVGTGGSAEQEHFIATRLAESRQRAAEAHTQQSQLHETAGRHDKALAEAELALEFARTDEAATRVGELRQRLTAQSVAMGRAAMDTGQWDQAVAALVRAHSLSPSAETQELLGRAQEGAAKAQAEAAARSLAEADRARTERQWPNAATFYLQANRLAPSPRTESLVGYCRAMASAEAAIAARDTPVARAHFERALTFGIDTEDVRARIRHAVQQRYRVTVHGATILPFKPESELRWDGPPGRLSDASSLIAELADVSGPQAVVTKWLASGFLSSIEPPDCFVVVRTAAGEVSNEAQAAPDTLLPTWNFSFDLMGCGADSTVIQFAVTDRDAVDHDPVGRWETTVGHLVAHEQPWQERFINEKRELRAGGILTLDLSVAPAESAAPIPPLAPAQSAPGAGGRQPGDKVRAPALGGKRK